MTEQSQIGVCAGCNTLGEDLRINNSRIMHDEAAGFYFRRKYCSNADCPRFGLFCGDIILSFIETKTFDRNA